MRTASVNPVWGENYDLGYVGFQFTDNDFVSKGICFFSGWEAWPVPITVSHTFIVSGPGMCIEAAGAGVVSASLRERFEDPHTHVFFRKPRWYDARMGNLVASGAGLHIGEHYAYGLIAAKLIARTIPGKWVDVLTKGRFNRSLCNLFDWPGTSDCDGLVARALVSSVLLRGMGVLRQPANSLTPQRLFEDQEIFVPWKQK